MISDFILKVKNFLPLGIISKTELFRETILVFDQDVDMRLYQAADVVIESVGEGKLILIYECDGNLVLIWDEFIPNEFVEGNSVPVYYFDDHDEDQVDHWAIIHSTVLQLHFRSNNILHILKKEYSFSLN